MFVVANNVNDLSNFASAIAIAFLRENSKSHDKHLAIEENYYVIPVFNYPAKKEIFKIKEEIIEAMLLFSFNMKEADFDYILFM